MKKSIPSPTGAEAAPMQHAALCYRPRAGGIEFLLVTSRDTGRWVLPKGWPMRGKSPAAAALREAYEEAGVSGRVVKRCLGYYAYAKTMPDGTSLPCMVSVFPVLVRDLRKDFPECRQRQRAWFAPAEAAARVAETELAQILLAFDPVALSEGG